MLAYAVSFNLGLTIFMTINFQFAVQNFTTYNYNKKPQWKILLLPWISEQLTKK